MGRVAKYTNSDSTRALFMSPRFGTFAHVNFIKQVNCTTILLPQGSPPVNSDVLEQYKRKCHIPSLEELFDQNHTYYEFKKTFEQARKEPLVMLHTSGSTGFPKPIIWTHDWAASFVRERRLEPPPGFDSTDQLLLGSRLLCSFPPFHVSISDVRILHLAHLFIRQATRSLVSSSPYIAALPSFICSPAHLRLRV